VAGGGPPVAVETTVQVQYRYHWQLFGSAIQLLFPGNTNYAGPITLSEEATAHNQT
jgi:hypothetical protein